MDLPVFDAHGGSLTSLSRREGASHDALNGSIPLARSLVVVEWSDQVLTGFNVRRQQWELPGGALEPGESAHDAAIRELVEETGIRVDVLRLVARAEFVFGGEASRHVAAWWHADAELWPATEPHRRGSRPPLPS